MGNGIDRHNDGIHNGWYEMKLRNVAKMFAVLILVVVLLSLIPQRVDASELCGPRECVCYRYTKWCLCTPGNPNAARKLWVWNPPEWTQWRITRWIIGR